MSEGLFELPPAALIYRRPHGVPMMKMRCRDCHELRPINGGGSTPARHDGTGGGGYDYAVCEQCFRTGEYGRKAGIAGRDLIELGATDRPNGSER